MMGRALLVVGWLGTGAFVAAGLGGYLLPDGGGGLPAHLLLGLVACLLLLFSHCWILFYLIGTGKAVKDAARRQDLGEAVVEETRRFKRVSNPPMMLAILLAMATFIVGGGVQTQVVPAAVHQALFVVTLLAQVWALRVEHRVLAANARLLAEVDRRLR